MTRWMGNKKRGNSPTAQPPTLAVSLPWGNSEGAGRKPLEPQMYILSSICS